MNETDVASWAELLQTFVIVVAIPLAGILIQRMQVRFDKDGQYTQWTDGAQAAAGRIALQVMLKRQTNPEADIKGVIDVALRSEAARLLANYGPAVPKLNPTIEAATTRIDGELGKLLTNGKDLATSAESLLNTLGIKR